MKSLLVINIPHIERYRRQNNRFGSGWRIMIWSQIPDFCLNGIVVFYYGRYGMVMNIQVFLAYI